MLLLTLNLLVKPFWIFGIDRAVQNAVGAGEYGLFFALFNFSLLLNIILDFGITNFNNREISRHAQMLPRFFSNMITIKLLMATAYFIVTFVIAFIIGYSSRQFWILGFLVFNQFLSSLILYFRSNISGLQLFKTDSILSVTDRVLMIILCAFLLWGPVRDQFHIEWFVYAQTVAYVATAIIAFLLVLKQSQFFTPKFDLRFFITIVKRSYPYALLVLLMSFYYRVDSVMLERMLPDGNVQSGIYAQAFRLLDAANMVPFLFASLLLPIFSKMIKTNEPVKSLLGFSFSLLFVFSFVVSVVCITFRNEIMSILYVHHSDQSSIILATLMVSFIFISMSYIFGTLLTANGSLKHLNIISFSGVIVNVILNLILIPKYYAVGAAVASLATQMVVVLFQILISCKKFSVKFDFKRVMPYVYFVAFTVLTVFMLYKHLPNGVLTFMLSLIVPALFSFLIGIISIKEVFGMFVTSSSTVNSEE